MRNHPVEPHEFRYRVWRKKNKVYLSPITMPNGTYKLLWFKSNTGSGSDGSYAAAIESLWPSAVPDEIRERIQARWFVSGAEIELRLPDDNEYRKKGDECVCDVCGKLYWDAFGWMMRNVTRRKLCSDVCARRDHSRVHVEALAKRRADARAGRHCDWCGKALAAARSTKRYCGTTCRGAARRKARPPS
jgi:hypothetical protein